MMVEAVMVVAATVFDFLQQETSASARVVLVTVATSALPDHT